MGEAKRRKKLDANFGKRDYVIDIRENETGCGIFLNDELVDVARTMEKAIEIKQWLTNQIKINPFPDGRLTAKLVTRWIYHNIDSFSNTEDTIILEQTKELKNLVAENDTNIP